MRILFDSKKTAFKTPFGTLTPGQACKLHIHIPKNVEATAVTCIVSHDGGGVARNVDLQKAEEIGLYEVFSGEFSLEYQGLYFYYFYIDTPSGGFRLFKQDDGTNMEAGDQLQLSCIPEAFHTPDWARGAIYYQVFPDRFNRSGHCDLTGKLTPYTLHRSWNEEVSWRPTKEGKVLNNDFFGGNLRGIREKLDHIQSLGVTALYLNPICKAFSSHRYDTGDIRPWTPCWAPGKTSQPFARRPTTGV